MKGFADKVKKLTAGRDFLAKLICLALAGAMWALVSSSKVETLKFKIPIMLKNLPPNLTVSNMSERFATVIFEGRNDDLKSPMLKSVKAVVNLENVYPGKPRYYPVEIEKQEIPEEIVVSTLTREVLLTVERKEDKWIEVIPSVTGRVPAGAIIIDKIVVPERVKVSGPRSVINEIQSVETEDVPVDNEIVEFERQVGIRKDDRLKDLTFGDTVFTVKVVIVDAKDIIALSCPLRIRGAVKEYGYEMKGSPVEVYVRSKANRAVTAADLDAFIDVGDMNVKKLFENEKVPAVWRELPIIVAGKNAVIADIVSYLPKKVWIKISRK
ncbi:MAG: hypothetical protein A2W19_12955 [Spirochaetes bacterium RBG_16_49_21]|nr:MAG: hypothetical protein A2W19_12955 [Spirochaetes bacterium RBG_16_49_21]